MNYRLLICAALAMPLTIDVALVSVATGQETPPVELQDPTEQALPDFPQIPPAEPPPTIDHDLAGWQEASSDVERIGERLRAQWVMIDEKDSVFGTIVGNASSDVAGMDIYLLRNGKVISQSSTDARGNFQLSGLTQGPYSLVGYSPSSFVTYGFMAIEHRADVTQFPRSITTRAVSRDDKLGASRLITDHSPQVRFRIYGDYSFGEDQLTDAANFGWQGLSTFDVAAEPATTIQSRSVTLAPGGLFTGRVHQFNDRNGRPVPILDTEVQLIKDGEVVATARCDSRGIFEMTGVQPGSYGWIAFGGDGFAVLGIQLVAGSPAASADSKTSARTKRHVQLAKATKRRPSGHPLAVALVQPESIGWINHHLLEQRFAEAMSQPRLQAPRQPFGPGFGPGVCPNCFGHQLPPGAAIYGQRAPICHCR